MLQWAVIIGRMDIHIAVMTMGRFRMQPRVGHLKRVERIFGYLNLAPHLGGEGQIIVWPYTRENTKCGKHTQGVSCTCASLETR